MVADGGHGRLLSEERSAGQRERYREKGASHGLGSTIGLWMHLSWADYTPDKTEGEELRGRDIG
jgi:hypothetical protein